MSHFREGNEAGDLEFSWGRKDKLGGKNLDVQYYKSFTYDGVEYFLYDCVYMWCDGQKEPHIGKLVKIFETPLHDRKVKVVWFFRPTEVQQWLRETSSLKNELFLGSGIGQGLSNINHLATISGKCNVICTSKDKRNSQASTEELNMSDCIFYRTFDVNNLKISERFPDEIAGVEVVHFFNQRKDLEISAQLQLKEHSKVTGKSISSSKFETDKSFPVLQSEHLEKDNSTNGKVLKLPAATAVRETCSSASVPDSSHLKKRKLEDIDVKKGKNGKNDNQFKMPKIQPEMDSQKWFKKQPWEDRMQNAHKTGSLLLLENLDPSITSLEVEDMAWYAFNKKVSAKMIQHTAFSSPDSGQALVIFKSKDEVDFAISALNTRCLMLGVARPVVGSRPLLKEPGNPSKYFGHLMVDKMRLQQRIEMRNAISTSHYSQPNTIEFEMSLEWRVLQIRSKIWWDALYKQQANEISGLKTQLKAPLSKFQKSTKNL